MFLTSPDTRLSEEMQPVGSRRFRNAIVADPQRVKGKNWTCDEHTN